MDFIQYYWLFDKNNIGMVELFIIYRNKYNIFLELNEKEKKMDFIHFCWLVTEIILKWLHYSLITVIKIILNEKDENGLYPVL